MCWESGMGRGLPCCAQPISAARGCQVTSVSSCPRPEPSGNLTRSNLCCGCLLWTCQPQLHVWMLPAKMQPIQLCSHALRMGMPKPSCHWRRHWYEAQRHWHAWTCKTPGVIFSTLALAVLLLVPVPLWLQSKGKEPYRAVLEILPLRIGWFPEG